MKLINGGNLMDGIFIDMGCNTNEHFIVKVFTMHPIPMVPIQVM